MSTMGDIGRQLLGIVLGGACVFSASCATAQITPDRTLPNNSNVTINGSIFNITGGTLAGRNLFHSFQQFSVPTGTTAFFNNGLDIQNIISRVTGGQASNIDGLIRASGTANLFFLNPNGIVFGQHASLNVGGSFVASTANSLKFADGFEYSAIAPQTTPLLTISVPSGLQFGTNPGSIQVQGDGQGIRTTSNLIDTTTGLRVQPNQTLALVGGDINLEGATLKTAGGRIELGSVAGNSLVSLTAIDKGFSLGYGGVQNFGNIQLSQQAAVDASGEGGGDIQVAGRSITLSDAQIQTNTLGSESGRAIVVKATELVKLSGTSELNAVVSQNATGNSGDVVINTRELLIQDGAQIGAGTFGAGKGGNLTVTADKVQLIGTSADNQFSSGLYTQTLDVGDAGSLTINTRELLLEDGAQAGSATFGVGKGGNLIVTADKVQLTGTSANGRFPSGLSASNQSGAGDAGDLTINTRELLVRDGAGVSTETFGTGKGGNLTVTADKVQLIGTSADGRFHSGLFATAREGSTGDAGNLTVNTRELFVSDGAQLGPGTFGTGKGGNLTVTADSVQLIGTSADGRFPSGLFASNKPGAATGDAGDLTINTRELLVRDGAGVSTETFGTGKGGNLTVTADKVQLIGTSADGRFHSGLFAQSNSGSTGNAGNLTVNARSILLDSKAVLTANTRSINTDPNKQQATITLVGVKDLILSRGSNITTNATQSNVIGGNINIDTDVLAAVEKSNISANSADARGGRVVINTQGLFRSPDSTITATGANPQLNGTVQINTPDIDPNRSLVTLPTVTEADLKPISSTCAAFDDKSGGSNFTVTGRSGLPPSPLEPLSSDVVWTDTRLPVTTTQQHQHKTHAAKPKSQSIAIVPATGWVFNDKGEVTLISSVSNPTSMNTPTSCPAR